MDGMGRLHRQGQPGWVASTNGGWDGAVWRLLLVARYVQPAFDIRLATWRDAPTRYNPCLPCGRCHKVQLGSQHRTQPLSPSNVPDRDSRYEQNRQTTIRRTNTTTKTTTRPVRPADRVTSDPTFLTRFSCCWWFRTPAPLLFGYSSSVGSPSSSFPSDL